MSVLNSEAYTMNKDNLVYDSKHPLDVANIEVTVPGTEAGTIERGQLIDYDDTDGTYSVHAENGKPSAIAAEETSYAADDTSALVTVYTSGSFRQSEVIAAPTITAAHLEILRSKGIYLK